MHVASGSVWGVWIATDPFAITLGNTTTERESELDACIGMPRDPDSLAKTGRVLSARARALMW